MEKFSAAPNFLPFIPPITIPPALIVTFQFLGDVKKNIMGEIMTLLKFISVSYMNKIALSKTLIGMNASRDQQPMARGYHWHHKKTIIFV